MAAGPFTRVSPFLSDSQFSLLPFRICPSDPRPRVLCCVQLGPCIRSLPLCRRPCIRSAEPRAKVAYHVQSFPPSKPSAPSTYADTLDARGILPSLELPTLALKCQPQCQHQHCCQPQRKHSLQAIPTVEATERWLSVAFCQNGNFKH